MINTDQLPVLPGEILQMDPFQAKVKESLDFFDIYNYHAPDIDISKSMYHRWTQPKDADFIISNIFGEIGWIEVKNISDKKFYVAATDARQWEKMRRFDEKFGTAFYLVNFKLLDKAFFFHPTWDFIKETGQFDPNANLQYAIEWTIRQSHGHFGKIHTSRILNLMKIPYFQRPTKLAVELHQETPTQESH